jgi:hypothetical protein
VHYRRCSSWKSCMLLSAACRSKSMPLSCGGDPNSLLCRQGATAGPVRPGSAGYQDPSYTSAPGYSQAVTVCMVRIEHYDKTTCYDEAPCFKNRWFTELRGRVIRLFWRSPDQISNRCPTTLTEVLRNLSQSLQVNSEIVRYLRQVRDCFIPHPFQFLLLFINHT